MRCAGSTPWVAPQTMHGRRRRRAAGCRSLRVMPSSRAAWFGAGVRGRAAVHAGEAECASSVFLSSQVVLEQLAVAVLARERAGRGRCYVRPKVRTQVRRRGRAGALPSVGQPEAEGLRAQHGHGPIGPGQHTPSPGELLHARAGVRRRRPADGRLHQGVLTRPEAAQRVGRRQPRVRAAQLPLPALWPSALGLTD